MDADKRKGEAPVPDHVKNYLNNDQLLSLRKLEGYGWTLYFIRRPMFQDVVPVVKSPDGKETAILMDDGELDTTTDIHIRP